MSGRQHDGGAEAKPAVAASPAVAPAAPAVAAPAVAAAPLLERLAERLGARAAVGTVFGKPVVAEGVTVIPVARVTFGIGGGGGHERAAGKAGEGLGVGAGAHARPAGFVEIRDGSAVFVPIRDRRPETLYGLAAVIAALAVPRIIKTLSARR